MVKNPGPSLNTPLRVNMGGIYSSDYQYRSHLRFGLKFPWLPARCNNHYYVSKYDHCTVSCLKCGSPSVNYLFNKSEI